MCLRPARRNENYGASACRNCRLRTVVAVVEQIDCFPFGLAPQALLLLLTLVAALMALAVSTPIEVSICRSPDCSVEVAMTRLGCWTLPLASSRFVIYLNCKLVMCSATTLSMKLAPRTPYTRRTNRPLASTKYWMIWM